MKIWLVMELYEADDHEDPFQLFQSAWDSEAAAQAEVAKLSGLSANEGIDFIYFATEVNNPAPIAIEKLEE